MTVKITRHCDVPPSAVWLVLMTVLSSLPSMPPLMNTRDKTLALLSTTVISFFIIFMGRFAPFRTRFDPSRRVFRRIEPRGLGGGKDRGGTGTGGRGVRKDRSNRWEMNREE